MSEYTPTTEEVRNWRTGGDDGLLRQEFDRWLEQVKDEAWDKGWDDAIDHCRMKHGVEASGCHTIEVTAKGEDSRAVWFDRWLEQVKAEAWDEGHTHCFHVENPHNPVKGNPYREETE